MFRTIMAMLAAFFDLDVDRGPQLDPELTRIAPPDGFVLLQEQYRQLNMRLVNQYHRLSPAQYEELMAHIKVLRVAIAYRQPGIDS
jgi:hypothetical protein